MSSIGSRLAGAAANPQFGAGYPQSQQYQQQGFQQQQSNVYQPPQQQSYSSSSPYNNTGVIQPQNVTPNRIVTNTNSGMSPMQQNQQQLYKPQAQGYSSPYYGGTPPQQQSNNPPNQSYNPSPQYSATPSYPVQQGYPPNHVGPQRYGVGGRSFVNQVSNYTQGKIPADFADIAIQKSIEIKDWGLKTYRCTKQMYNEKVGKGTRTVDFHLDQKIEKIKDTKARYTRVLELTTLLQVQLSSVQGTHRALAEVFQDLSGKQDELEGEFGVNGKVFNAINEQSDTLIKTLDTVKDSLQTLVEKTIQDSLDTITNYEKTRVEFDAYRNQLEEMQMTPMKNNTHQKMRDIQMKLDQSKSIYDKKRSDVQVKLELLDENRIKVMKQQMHLLHSATVSYFNGSHEKVMETLKLLEKYQSENQSREPPSFLEINDPNDLKMPRAQTGSRLASYSDSVAHQMTPTCGRTPGTPGSDAPQMFDMLGEPIYEQQTEPTGYNGGSNQVYGSNFLNGNGGVPTIATNNIVQPEVQPLVNFIATSGPVSGLQTPPMQNSPSASLNGVNLIGVVNSSNSEEIEKIEPEIPLVDSVDLINTDDNDLTVQFKEATI